MMTMKVKKWGVYVATFIACFLVLLLFSVSTSPLYSTYRYDSAVFQTMGRLLLNGGIPYVDIFDHKGCVLFFINALGLWINSEWGLLVLQTAFLTVSVILFCKLSCLYKNGWQSIMIIVVLFMFVIGYFPDGNTSEEWSVLFNAIPICLYLTIQRKRQPETYSFYFICGICFGLIAFNRLNDAVFLGIPLFTLLRSLAGKKWKKFFLSALTLLAGLIAVVVLCCGAYYLIAGKAGVSEMIFGTFIYNFSYFSTGGIDDAPMYRYVIAYLRVALFMLIPLMNIKHADKQLLWPLLCCYMIGIVSRGTRLYTHYFIVFIPLYMVSLLMWNRKSVRQTIVVVLAIVGIAYPSYCGIKNMVDSYKEEPELAETTRHYREIMAVIPNEERSEVYNLNTGFVGLQCLLSSQMTQCNKIVLISQLEASERLRERVPSLQSVNPLWILAIKNEGRESEEWNYVNNSYSLVKSDMRTGLSLYKRK